MNSLKCHTGHSSNIYSMETAFFYVCYYGHEAETPPCECRENQEIWQRNCDCFRTMVTEVVSSLRAVLLVVRGLIAGRPRQQINDATK